ANSALLMSLLPVQGPMGYSRGRKPYNSPPEKQTFACRRKAQQALSDRKKVLYTRDKNQPPKNTGNMSRQHPPKSMAATALDHARAHRHHVIAVVALSAFVALSATLMPSGEVEANRQEALTSDLQLDAGILEPIKVSATPLEADLGA